jgi:hypothetical protein
MDPIVGRKKPRIPDLSHELEEYTRTGDPQKLLDALRHEAQIKRFEAGIEAEEIKNLAVNVLRKAVASPDISINVLLRITDSLSKSSESVLKDCLGVTGRQRRRRSAATGPSPASFGRTKPNS